MRLPYPGSGGKSVESQATYSPEDLGAVLAGYSPQDRVKMIQALLAVGQDELAESKVIEGGCTGPFKGWSACVSGKCLDLDLIDVANRAAAHGYRPVLAIDEAKSVLGFVPIEGSKGQLVADPYDAFKGIFGPLVAKGVGVSLSIDL